MSACIQRKGPLAPFEIIEGQRKITPQPMAVSEETVIQGEHKTITVKKGDTLFSISREEGVPIQYIIEENALTAPYAIHEGQTLVIPANKLHVVKEGDTLYSISRLHGVNMWSLATFNGLSDPFIIKIGEALKLPGRMERIVQKMPASLDKKEKTELSPAEKAQKERLKKMVPAPRSASKFLMPTSGSVISAYGPRKGGLQNDGINIAAPKGTPVKAAENGIVVYSGDGIKSFGNLVLIKHSDGWVSAYGHVDKISVHKGDKITRGQDIATVGATGLVDKPQLHFELRRGSKTVNPADYI